MWSQSRLHVQPGFEISFFRPVTSFFRNVAECTVAHENGLAACLTPVGAFFFLVFACSELTQAVPFNDISKTQTLKSQQCHWL